MTKAKTGLGKGFEALLPKDFERGLIDDSDKIKQVALFEIEVNSLQPRTKFDEAKLSQLADSIKRYGILQPLVVTSGSDKKYMIIAGERRFRAAKLAGLDKVPAVVRTAKEMERLELALVENVQREDLSPLEQAASIEYLNKKFNIDYQTIAERLGKGKSTVANLIRLLGLPDEAKAALAEGKITEAHARAILALKDNPAAAQTLLKNILDYHWTVTKAEQFVVAMKQHAGGDTEKASSRLETETTGTRQLAKYLNTPVKLRRSAHGGRLEISFRTDEELDEILGRLGK